MHVLNHRMRIAALFALSLVCLSTLGCGYGKVSPEGYQYAITLYSICNRHDEKRLTVFVDKLDSATSEGELTEKEAGWMKEIAVQAQAGDWQAATTEARKLIGDQVTGGP